MFLVVTLTWFWIHVGNFALLRKQVTNSKKEYHDDYTHFLKCVNTAEMTVIPLSDMWLTQG